MKHEILVPFVTLRKLRILYLSIFCAQTISIVGILLMEIYMQCIELAKYCIYCWHHMLLKNLYFLRLRFLFKQSVHCIIVDG